MTVQNINHVHSLSHNSSLHTLIARRRWRTLDASAQIGAVYHFVKDELPFGYNRGDDLSAEDVLADGYGQCNTKSTLLFALLQMLGHRVRFRGMTIDKALQRGAIPNWLFFLAPARIIHSWIEVWFDEQWIALEGVILDEMYLEAVQRRFKHKNAFKGFGIATTSLHRPNVRWCGRSTFIQREGVAEDFGVFDTPADFYREYGTNLRGLRRWLYVHVFRHVMNRRVASIRAAVVAVESTGSDPYASLRG